MKQIINVVSLIMMACFVSLPAVAQDLPGTLTQTRSLEQFDKIIAANGINVKVYDNQLEEAEIKVKGVPLENIITEVEGSTLKVRLKVSVKNKDVSVLVKVSYKTLTEIEAITGAVVETGRPLSGDLLKLRASTGGVIKAEVEHEKIVASAASESEILLFGKTQVFEASATLGGEIKAYKLNCKVANVKATGGGDVDLYVTEDADLFASFGGIIRVKGNPYEIEKKTITGGEIKVLTATEYGKDLIRDE